MHIFANKKSSSHKKLLSPTKIVGYHQNKASCISSSKKLDLMSLSLPKIAKT